MRQYLKVRALDKSRSLSGIREFTYKDDTRYEERGISLLHAQRNDVLKPEIVGGTCGRSGLAGFISELRNFLS